MKRAGAFFVAVLVLFAVFGKFESASYRHVRSVDEVQRVYDSIDALCYREGSYSRDEIEAMRKIKQAGATAMNSDTEVSITDIVNREVSNRTIADALIEKFPAFVMCVMRESQLLQERTRRPSTSAKRQ